MVGIETEKTMSGFPLYDNLIQQLPKKDLIVKQKEELISNMAIIDLNGRELVYALIYVFYMQNVNKECLTIPYKGSKEQVSDKKPIYTLTWNIMDFPIKLRQLLYKFTVLHIKTIHQEEPRSSSQIVD